MLHLFWFLAALVPTLLVGLPVALALAKPGRLLAGPTARTKHTSRARVEVAPAFAPLDLGPDPVHWPSERAWPASTLKTPDWPSATWNDEHFGKAGRRAHAVLKDAPPMPSEARAAAAPAQRQKRGPPQVPAARKATPPPPPAPVEQAPALAPPDRDQIEHLVAEVGLAGTVQAIIDRTGWDFRQAAQYLARIRSKG